MPRLVCVVYNCGCSARGNPDFICPRHKEGVSRYENTGVQLTHCTVCRRKFEFNTQFSWKEDRKTKEMVAAHTKCLLSFYGWKSGTEGKYSHVKSEEISESNSNQRESRFGQRQHRPFNFTKGCQRGSTS